MEFASFSYINWRLLTESVIPSRLIRLETVTSRPVRVEPDMLSPAVAFAPVPEPKTPSKLNPVPLTETLPVAISNRDPEEL